MGSPASAADPVSIARAAARLGCTPMFLREVLYGEDLPPPQVSTVVRDAAAALIRRRASVLSAPEPEVSAALTEIADGYAPEANRA